MLALIKDNQIKGHYSTGEWIDLPNGNRFGPAYDGWTNGEYKLEVIQEADAIPEGKQVSFTAVEMVNGHPKFVNLLEDIPVIVPDRVTSRQFMVMLDIMGLYDQVESWIETQDRKIQLAFRHSGTFVKDEPMMQAGFAALGFSQQQIDDFFTAANSL